MLEKGRKFMTHVIPPLNVTDIAVCRVLATGFPKSDHVSNGITIAHVIAFFARVVIKVAMRNWGMRNGK